MSKKISKMREAIDRQVRQEMEAQAERRRIHRLTGKWVSVKQLQAGGGKGVLNVRKSPGTANYTSKTAIRRTAGHGEEAVTGGQGAGNW